MPLLACLPRTLPAGRLADVCLASAASPLAPLPFFFLSFLASLSLRARRKLITMTKGGLSYIISDNRAANDREPGRGRR